MILNKYINNTLLVIVGLLTRFIKNGITPALGVTPFLVTQN